jgi:hypothetical protein
MLFVLDAAKGHAYDIQRLVSYDYLLVHSGDVKNGPDSIHPSVPLRGAELLVKRDVIGNGLNQMFSRELIDKVFRSSGILYLANPLTRAFTSLLQTKYAEMLRFRSSWLVGEFGHMSDTELSAYMSRNIGRWGAEFERLSAIKDLEL